MLPMTLARKPQERKKPLLLTAEISQTSDRLLINYRMANNGDKPIYVWDQMINYNSNGQFIDPDLAYVFWEAPRTLRIVRAMLALPVHFEVTKKEVPFVRKLLPRDVLQGRVALALPVQEFSPFYPSASRFHLVSCEKVRLIIGWAEEKKGMAETHRRVGDADVIALKGAWGEPTQNLAEVTLTSTAQLKVSDEEFDRQLPLH